MYSTCLFCRSSLGHNETIEHFPVGRRLAFDSKNGRLWVICKSCERWNLTPMEERWEALEECEIEFEGTRLRVSTAHIGLARLKSGLELVRIGQPMRPEFAAWRYGDQFGRRRQKHILLVSAATIGVGGLLIGQYAMGLALGGTSALSIANGLRTFYIARKTVATVRARDELLAVTLSGIDSTQLLWSSTRNEWSILIPRKTIWSLSQDSRPTVLSEEASDFLKKSGRHGEAVVEVQGIEARYALGKIMARVNLGGGAAKTVQSAVTAIEQEGSSGQFLEKSGRMFAANRRLLGMSIPEKGGNLKAIPPELRLAMEMAANEESEWNALHGELVLLEAEWQAAEDVAAISDRLLIPPDVEHHLQVLKDENLKS